MREQKTSGAFDLGGLDLLPLLRPAIEKLLRELLNEFLSGDGLARLLGLQAAAKGELHAPPVKEKKPRKRGKKAHAPSDAKSAKPSVAPVIAPAKPAIAKPPPLPHDADGEWIEVKKPVSRPLGPSVPRIGTVLSVLWMKFVRRLVNRKMSSKPSF